MTAVSASATIAARNDSAYTLPDNGASSPSPGIPLVASLTLALLACTPAQAQTTRHVDLHRLVAIDDARALDEREQHRRVSVDEGPPSARRILGQQQPQALVRNGSGPRLRSGRLDSAPRHAG